MLSAASLLLALTSPVFAETITPIAGILANRDRANGRNFCVVGKPVEINQKVGEVTGKHLFRGKIDDGTGRLVLFAYGNFPSVSLGEAIEVCGRYDKFYLSKGSNGYHNQLKAALILKGKNIAADRVNLGEIITLRAKQDGGPPAP